MNEPSVFVTLAPVVGTVIVALIGVFTGWLGLRANKSQKKMDQASAKREQLDKFYDQLNDDMQKRIESLNVENDDLRDRMKTLEESMQQMQEQRVRDRAAIDLMVEYARTLVQLLRANGVTVPTAPVELAAYGIGADLRRL